jgi:hypothetical protein
MIPKKKEINKIYYYPQTLTWQKDQPIQQWQQYTLQEKFWIPGAILPMAFYRG